MTIQEANINCQKIKFNQDTHFLIQVSRQADKKSKFLTVTKVEGDVFKAMRLFRDLDLREGYRKRLYAHNLVEGFEILATYHKV